MSVDLHECARSGDVIHLRLMLCTKGVNVDQRDLQNRSTALHYAVMEHQAEAVEMLLDAGANANIEDQELKTPLHYVITKTGDPKISFELAKLLLAAGADPTNKSRDGDTLLHVAAKEGHNDLIAYVLEERRAEIDIDETNDRGETALYLAAASGHANAIVQLIQGNANPNMPTSKGRTPLGMALRWAKSELKAAIESAAARAPKIEYVTLPSGTVIRKDLLPESFDDIRQKLARTKDSAIERRLTSAMTEYDDAAAERTALNLSAGAQDNAFTTQVTILGGRNPQETRRAHLDRPLVPAPAQTPPAGGEGGFGMHRTNSMRSFVSSHTAQSGGGRSAGRLTIGSGTDVVTTTEDVALAQQIAAERLATEKQKEHIRLADKERVRVDQRLRGLFYAGIKKKMAQHKGPGSPVRSVLSPGSPERGALDRSGVGVGIGSPVGPAGLPLGHDPAKFAELEHLTAEIKSLKEAGFRDTAKEMRRIKREKTRAARAERRAERDRLFQEELGQQASQAQVGELSAQLLEPDVQRLIPASNVFSLRRLVCPKSRPNEHGLFSVINNLELKMKGVSQQTVELSKRADQLRQVQDVVKQEIRSGMQVARKTAPRADRSQQDGVMELTRKDHRVIEDLRKRIDILEKVAKRDIVTKRKELLMLYRLQGYLVWVVKIGLLFAVVAYIWAHKSVMPYLPPPLW